MAGNENDSARYFIRGLFRGIGETERISEQREELEAHIVDRVADGMAEGLSHDEAFSRAVESLGNLDELIETMTGTKKKIYDRKADWLLMAAGVAFGTAYMLAVGIWFSFRSFGLYSICVAAVGWLGYAVPAGVKYFMYRANPTATAMVPLDNPREVRAAVIGWISISVACWILNALFFGTDLFLHEVWAWMPMVGTATWPLMNAGYYWMVRNLKAIECADRAV